MKKLATLIIALAAVVGAVAQPKAGTFTLTPTLGLNLSTITGDAYNRTYTIRVGKDLNETVKAKSQTHAGGSLGVEAGYQVSNRFALSAGVVFSLQGTERSKSGGGLLDDYRIKDDSELDLVYLNVPILANFYVCKGLALKVGVQPALLLSAKDHTEVSASGQAAEYAKDAKQDVKNTCNTFDFSIPVGVSYEFDNGIILEGRFNIGTSDVFKNVKGHNMALQVSCGYKFKL